MTTSTTRGWRRLATWAVSASLISGIAPASATHQPAVASVNLREALPGAERSFAVSVVHPSGSGDPIRQVRITAPESSDPLVLVRSGQASGWVAQVSGNSVIFTSMSGLAPGQAATLTVVGDVPSRAADACEAWLVEVSSDGSTFAPATSSAGALTTCVRVLKVESVGLVAPQGVQDGSATQGQTGACARMSVRSMSTIDLVVVPGAEGPNLGVGLAQAEGAPPCSGSELAEGKAPLAPGETRTFDFRLSFGDPGVTTLRGSATAPGITGVQAMMPVTIQPQARLSYVNGTIIPRSLQPGTSGVVFRLTTTKGPAGSPAITLDPASSTFSFEGCGPVGLMTAWQISQGSIPNVVLEFQACSIGFPNDGRYPTTVRYRYMDENGFGGDLELSGVDRVRIDGSIPLASFSVGLPTPMCCVPPATRAVRNGSQVTLSGTVTDHDPDTGGTEPCPTCYVQTELRQYVGETCVGAGTPPVVVTASNTSGTLAAAYSGSYDPSTRSLRWVVIVRDEAGNGGSPYFSDCIPVDNQRPVMTTAETQRVGTEQNRLKVTLSECVAGSSGPLDWRILGNAVLEVESVTCGMIGGQPRTTIRLRTALPFPDDAPSGSLRYEPFPVAGSMYYDRVGWSAQPHEVPISDGIPTGTPGLW